MNSTLPPEVRARVDGHLDAVETQLNAAGVPREKRRGIVDDLETHILEMLDSAGNRPPTLAEVDAMISRLDPPEAYGKETMPPLKVPPPPAALAAAGEPQLCRQARQGIGWIMLALLAQVAVMQGLVGRPKVDMPPAPARDISHLSQGFIMPGEPPRGVANSGPSAGMLVLVAILMATAVVAPIIGTALGWSAVERIRNSGGKLYGLILATFEALFYPLVVVWSGAFLLWYWIIIAYYDGPEVPNRGRAVCLIGGACTAMVLSVILGWLLRRLSRPNASAIQ